MDKEMIKNVHHTLEQKLHFALSRMDRSQDVYILRKKIKELQSLCPHDGESEVCPYCGKGM